MWLSITKFKSVETEVTVSKLYYEWALLDKYFICLQLTICLGLREFLVLLCIDKVFKA